MMNGQSPPGWTEADRRELMRLAQWLSQFPWDDYWKRLPIAGPHTPLRWSDLRGASAQPVR